MVLAVCVGRKGSEVQGNALPPYCIALSCACVRSRAQEDYSAEGIDRYFQENLGVRGPAHANPPYPRPTTPTERHTHLSLGRRRDEGYTTVSGADHTTGVWYGDMMPAQ